MPDGEDCLTEIAFERNIGKMGDRELLEFTARQGFSVRKEMKAMTDDIANNKKRSWTNRVILLLLITSLAITGILDAASVIHFL